MTVLLASRSPRRRELLSRLHVPFSVAPSGADERPPTPGEDPVAYALELAHHKARAVSVACPEWTVLAADTVVVVDDKILGKPEDEPDAVRMLMLLSGKSHTVVTAVVVRRGDRVWSGSRSATVTMLPYPLPLAEAYARGGEPMDKAGAYAVQGEGSRLVQKVDGCYLAVVGLPLCLTMTLLTAAGVSVPQTVSCCTS